MGRHVHSLEKSRGPPLLSDPLVPYKKNIMRTRHWRPAIPFALFLLGAAGCGGGVGIQGETGTVHGTVLRESKPIPAGSSVVLMHLEKGSIATGSTDEAGHFTPRMRGSPRVLVGNYAVGVTPPVPEDADAQAQLEMEATLNAKKQEKGKKIEPAKASPPAGDAAEIPEHYLSPETSGERFKVQAGDNQLDLNLTPK